MKSRLLDRVRTLIHSSESSQASIARTLGLTPQRLNDLLIQQPNAQLQRIEAVLELLDNDALNKYTGQPVNTKQADMFVRARTVIQQLSQEMENYND